ncbi:MAG: response regulator transcription factor [Bacteroidales bacterium]
MVVVIIDRTPFTMSRLAAMLAETEEVDVMVKVVNPEDAKEKVMQYQPDVVIMDLNLTGTDSLGLIMEISRVHQKIRWIGLTSYAVEQYRKTCREAGVEYCLDKNHDFERIPALLKKIKTNNSGKNA